MAIQSISQLKNWFRTNLKPTQQQFWDWMDSYRHKSDAIAINDVTGLQTALDDAASSGGSGGSGSSSADVPVSGSASYSIAAASFVDHIVLIANNAGTIRVGTTSGGNEIEEVTLQANEAFTVSLGQYYVTSASIHFTGDCTSKIYLR